MPTATKSTSYRSAGLRDDPARALQRASTKPDLRALNANLAECLAQAGTVRDRQERARRIRHLEWDGQSDDFRKHADDIGEAARPFEGAADTRPRIADGIINERAAMLVEAMMGSEIQAVPVKLEDAETVALNVRLLRHLRDVAMQGELRTEAKLLANYQEGDDPAIGILKVYWLREYSLELRALTAEEVGREVLAALGVTIDPAAEVPMATVLAVADVADMLWNPEREAEALEALALPFPTVPPKLLRRSLRDLRRSGETKLPVPYVKENRGCVVALRFGRDVFFPADVDRIEDCRAIHEVERVSEAELRGRVLSELLGADFVAELIETGPGPSGLGTDSSRGRTEQYIAGQREEDQLYELIYSYSRAADEYGVPGIYLTVWSAKCPNHYGKHELLDYPDGQYPYVLFRREYIDRGVHTSRSVAVLAGPAQHEIKVQRDCRTDNTQLSTVPPVKVRMRRGGLEAMLGPMVEVPVKDADDVTWMNPPPFPQASIEVERATRAELNEYFGRLVEGVAPELRQALLQDMANSWTNTWVTAYTKLLQLHQAYMDPSAMAAVTGKPMAPMTREEIRSRFHLLLKFSMSDLNLEFVTKRLSAIGQVLAWDSAGQVDRSAVLRVAFRGIDPTLADVGLRDVGVVTGLETKDEQSAVSQMAGGIEPPLQKSGINAELRLRVMIETIQRSPVLMRRYAQPATPEDVYFRELVENRQKNLRFQVEQYQQNPEIGRTGTQALQAPVL